MKKKLAIIILIVLVAAAILLLGKFIRTPFSPEPKVDKELEEKLGSDFFTSFDTNEPADSDKNSAAISNIIREKLDETEPAPNKSSGDSSVGTSSVPPSEKEIVEKYLPRLDALQQLSTSRLETLVATAYQEYQEQRKSGSVNRVALAQKYMAAAERLESNIDKSFYSTVEQMKAELEENKHSTAIVDDIKKEYEKAKSSKRQELLKRMQNKK
ncbi:MAG: hypothetical protein PHP87_09990 [Syntrophomonas sp.]|uniref:hypothetical protein n=1 Tax=Syntrophomonas sp. TaxID=2053627 RepID=UPI0026368EAA|nr:hypothetical protein [Syntrophomonas sp.]MDD4627392.1 hypothetical protein [Syntrophomonas sp.]